MEKSDKVIYCADVIARCNFGNKIVVIERLNPLLVGLALPGGKQNVGETLTDTARREFSEETGLSLIIHDILCVRADEGRDPRGRYVSVFFMGAAHGNPRDESGKTKVRFIDISEIGKFKDQFILDHGQVLAEYERLLHFPKV